MHITKHARERIEERYGFRLRPKEIKEIIRKCVNDDSSTPSNHPSHTRRVTVIHNQHKLRLVYDYKRKTIVTALPIEDT
jgi:predicted oxidoreductase (fatty acid repression mutant protein)